MPKIIVTWLNTGLSDREDIPLKSEIEIGLLELIGNAFQFSYLDSVKDAVDAGMPLPLGFPDVKQVYKSESLFPIFGNRIMSRERPSYAKFLESIGASKNSGPLYELGVTNGKKATDSYRTYFALDFSSKSESFPFFPELESSILKDKAWVKSIAILAVGAELKLVNDDLYSSEKICLGKLPPYYARIFQEHAREIELSFQLKRINLPVTSYFPELFLVDVTVSHRQLLQKAN